CARSTRDYGLDYW
nr:immunoglobulin heavy chain junction region [Mus musculus]